MLNFNWIILYELKKDDHCISEYDPSFRLRLRLSGLFQRYVGIFLVKDD